MILNSLYIIFLYYIYCITCLVSFDTKHDFIHVINKKMRKDLIEQDNSKLFYIFDTTDTTEQSFFSFSDSEKHKNLKYLLRLYVVCLDGRKIRINLTK